MNLNLSLELEKKKLQLTQFIKFYKSEVKLRVVPLITGLVTLFLVLESAALNCVTSLTHLSKHFIFQ